MKTNHRDTEEEIFAREARYPLRRCGFLALPGCDGYTGRHTVSVPLCLCG
jgi:hypothetical protein